MAFARGPDGSLGLALLVITAATGLILVSRYAAGDIEIEELSEIILMPMILVAMAWHARRREGDGSVRCRPTRTLSALAGCGSRSS